MIWTFNNHNKRYETMLQILTNPKYIPVICCVCFYTFLMIWFLFHKDYAYAWYWFSAMNITFASVLMAGR